MTGVLVRRVKRLRLTRKPLCEGRVEGGVMFPAANGCQGWPLLQKAANIQPRTARELRTVLLVAFRVSQILRVC